LLLAALMTAIGIAVPLIDSGSLQTLLFLAGAGLAATVLLLPWQLSPAAEDFCVTRRTAQPPHFATGSSRGHAHFAELVARPAAATLVDRVVWARLSAQMSHELRTPLNAVLGFSELMTNEVFGPLGSSCYSGYARDIHASGRLLLKSAEDALAITALLTAPDRKGMPQSTRLKSVADEALAFTHHDLGALSIAVSSCIDPDMDVVGDSQALRQMLINLISEASRNASSGSTLRIGTECGADCVTVSIAIAGDDLKATATGSDFPLILARTLCELCGARLSTAATADGGRDWTVRFLPAAQNDLFLRRSD
jgi:two-component system cell cycle sensor histidine kinase PleC